MKKSQTEFNLLSFLKQNYSCRLLHLPLPVWLGVVLQLRSVLARHKSLPVSYIPLFLIIIRWVLDCYKGIILLIVIFDAVIRSFRKVRPIICCLFIAYTFLGHYLPQPFWHFPVKLKAAISQYNIGLHGMFGLALGVSANYIFLFMLFGALLSASGANQFFTQIGALAGRCFGAMAL